VEGAAAAAGDGGEEEDLPQVQVESHHQTLDIGFRSKETFLAQVFRVWGLGF
jgi:hypothetical protein